MARQITQGYGNSSTFEEYIKVMRTFTDPQMKMMMITSWNEWMEDTQIEPTIVTPPTNLDQSSTGKQYTQGYIYEGYGTKYLEIVKELLGSSVTTGIEETHSENTDPYNFRLEQNYPNPFKSYTNISFDIKAESSVTLLVFDNIGRKVAVLVSKELPVGTYKSQWNASGLSSGIYFCQLKVGKFVDTKKIILVK